MHATCYTDLIDYSIREFGVPAFRTPIELLCDILTFWSPQLKFIIQSPGCPGLLKLFHILWVYDKLGSIYFVIARSCIWAPQSRFFFQSKIWKVCCQNNINCINIYFTSVIKEMCNSFILYRFYAGGALLECVDVLKCAPYLFWELDIS